MIHFNYLFTSLKKGDDLGLFLNLKKKVFAYRVRKKMEKNK